MSRKDPRVENTAKALVDIYKLPSHLEYGIGEKSYTSSLDTITKLHLILREGRIQFPENLSVLDVGSRCAEYLRLMKCYLEKYDIKGPRKEARNVTILGVEGYPDRIDNGETETIGEIAIRNIKNENGIQYKIEDILNVECGVDLITFFYPMFTGEAAKNQNIPWQNPQEIFYHLGYLMKEKGRILAIISQEYERADLNNVLGKNNLLIKGELRFLDDELAMVLKIKEQVGGKNGK